MTAYKVMSVFCLNCGYGFELYFMKEYPRLQNILNITSNQIKQGIAQNENHSKLRIQKQLRKQIILLISNF